MGGVRGTGARGYLRCEFNPVASRIALMRAGRRAWEGGGKGEGPLGYRLFLCRGQGTALQ